MRNVSTSSSAFAESGSSITILIWLTVETRHSWVPRNVGWKLSWRFFLGRTYDTKTFYGLKLATLNTWYRVNYFSQSFPEGVQSCFFLVQYRPTPATELSEVVMQKLFQSVCVLFLCFFARSAAELRPVLACTYMREYCMLSSGCWSWISIYLMLTSEKFILRMPWSLYVFMLLTAHAKTVTPPNRCQFTKAATS